MPMAKHIHALTHAMQVLWYMAVPMGKLQPHKMAQAGQPPMLASTSVKHWEEGPQG